LRLKAKVKKVKRLRTGERKVDKGLGEGKRIVVDFNLR